MLHDLPSIRDHLAGTLLSRLNTSRTRLNVAVVRTTSWMMDGEDE